MTTIHILLMAPKHYITCKRARAPAKHPFGIHSMSGLQPGLMLFVLPIWWLSNGLDVHFSDQLKHHFICEAGSKVSFV